MRAYAQRVSRSEEQSFVYRLKADARFARGWHFHPEYELTYIRRSRGKRFVGESIEAYRSGDLVLLGPDLPHTWRSEEPNRNPRGSAPRRRLHRAIVVQFREDFLGAEFFAAPECRGIAALLDRASRGLRFQGTSRDDVATRLQAMQRTSGLERLLEFLAVLDTLARTPRNEIVELCPHRPRAAARAQREHRFDRVLTFVHENFTQPLSQPEVASVVGMSPSSFCRFFRRATGKTFIEYVTELRVRHACTFLIESQLSVLEVSLQSGFGNLSHFNRQFRKLQGMTPSEFRKSHAEAAAE